MTYKAKFHGSIVAVKEFHDSYTQEGLSEFRNEVSILASLRHPFIIRFIGMPNPKFLAHTDSGISYSEPDKLFLVMEFCPHVLSDIIGKRSMNQASHMNLMAQLASGMPPNGALALSL